MFSLSHLLTFDIQNEYESAYDLSLKLLFSNPKIYSAKGDLTKRWHVCFSFLGPTTRKMKRITPIYGKTNKYKTKEERMSILVAYRKSLLKLLEQGYNPFADNIELYNQLNGHSVQTKNQLSQSKIVQVQEKEIEEDSMTLKETFEFGLKEKLINSTTKRRYQNKVTQLLKWLDTHRPKTQVVTSLNKKIITEFLNDVLNRTSARNRNNFRTELGSIMQVLGDNEIVRENYIRKLPLKLKFCISIGN